MMLKQHLHRGCTTIRGATAMAARCAALARWILTSAQAWEHLLARPHAPSCDGSEARKGASCISSCAEGPLGCTLVQEYKKKLKQFEKNAEWVRETNADLNADKHAGEVSLLSHRPCAPSYPV